MKLGMPLRRKRAFSACISEADTASTPIAKAASEVQRLSRAIHQAPNSGVYTYTELNHVKSLKWHAWASGVLFHADRLIASMTVFMSFGYGVETMEFVF